MHSLWINHHQPYLKNKFDLAWVTIISQEIQHEWHCFHKRFSFNRDTFLRKLSKQFKTSIKLLQIVEIQRIFLLGQKATWHPKSHPRASVSDWSCRLSWWGLWRPPPQVRGKICTGLPGKKGCPVDQSRSLILNLNAFYKH